MFALLLAAAACRQSVDQRATSAADGRFTVLAGEAPIVTEPGAAAIGRLLFGQEIVGVSLDGGWVRFEQDGELRYAARALLESAGERELREKETAEVLALAPHPGRATGPAALHWWPRVDSPTLGALEVGARVKIYTAEGDFYAIELADPASDRRYVAYVTMSAIALEPEPLAPPEDRPIRAVEARIIESGSASGAEFEQDDGEDTESPSTASGDRPATLIEKIDPVYPLAAERERLAGLVRLRIRVAESGQVEKVEILESPRSDFSAAASRAVLSWRYQPALREGRPAPVWKIVEIRFQPAP